MRNVIIVIFQAVLTIAGSLTQEDGQPHPAPEPPVAIRDYSTVSHKHYMYVDLNKQNRMFLNTTRYTQFNCVY